MNLRSGQEPAAGLLGTGSVLGAEHLGRGRAESGRAAVICCGVGDVWYIKGANVREELQTRGLQKLLSGPSVAEHCVPGLWNVQAVQPAVSEVLALSCPHIGKSGL